MTNLYHIIDFIPGIDKEEMLVGYEDLANKLVESGRLRIDAGTKINFARLYVPKLRISMVFSYREIYDSQLIPSTLSSISREIQKTSAKDIDFTKQEFFKILVKEINKHPQPSKEEELKLARLIVQAAHPIVITLALLDKAEIYISHHHNIGDTLDIVSWQEAGQNSGMQSTNGKDVGVFISCGGDPLAIKADNNAIYGDGWPALARTLIIGGQELGHYSDIMRDNLGRQVGRYSANFSATKAKENVKIARKTDIKKTLNILTELDLLGLSDLIKIEKKLRFYSVNNKMSFIFAFTYIRAKLKEVIFLRKAIKQDKIFLKTYSAEKYPGIFIKAIFEDMLFNLSPKADVYQGENEEATEAIACVEALARVPQQVNKWGHSTTKILMSDLYKIYYASVIPGCIRAYSDITGLPFLFDKRPIKTSFIYKIKSMFKLKHFPKRIIE